MKFIRDNFWQMLIAGAILLWVGWVSLGVHHSVSEEKLTKATDQYTRSVELMVTVTQEVVTKKDFYESIREVREDMRTIREDMRTIREDMRAGFKRIDRRLEALEKRLDRNPSSD